VEGIKWSLIQVRTIFLTHPLLTLRPRQRLFLSA
jgi:hypothetical protein